jgi:NADH-quinone oxidoreductase subunit D
MTSYIRIGGVALEPPAGWREMVARFLKMMPSRIDEYETLLTENRIWMARTKGVGVINAKDAVAYSMTGPTLRAAGLAYDNRKVFPYSSYEEFDFNVPTRTDADCFARYMLRVAEMRESLKIIAQAMEKITDQGEIRAEAAGIIPPQREKMKTEMEALIYHFKIFTEGFSPPPGEAYVTIESPRGELGCFIASDGSAKPLRCHFRSPSYINLQALPKIVEGQIIADVVACIGTIDIVLGEVDR